MVKAVNTNAYAWLPSSQDASDTDSLNRSADQATSNTRHDTTQQGHTLDRINSTTGHTQARLTHQGPTNESLRAPAHHEQDRLSQATSDSEIESQSERGSESDSESESESESEWSASSSDSPDKYTRPDRPLTRKRQYPRLATTGTGEADDDGYESDNSASDNDSTASSDTEPSPPKRKRPRRQQPFPASGPIRNPDNNIDGDEDDEAGMDIRLEPDELLNLLFGNADGIARGSAQIKKSEYLKASGLDETQQEAHWNTIVAHFEKVVKNFEEKHRWIGNKINETFKNPNLTDIKKHEIFENGRQLQSQLSDFLSQTQDNKADSKLKNASAVESDEPQDMDIDTDSDSDTGSESTEAVILPFDTNSIARLETRIRAFEDLLPEYKSGWLNPEQLKIGFDDVAGCHGPKADCKQLVHMLKHPENYERVKAKIPKGILFDGPPGVGKTLMAKAIAKEAGIPFCSKAGSDFVRIYVGQGAKSIQELVEQAKLRQPCIVFIDEIDALGRERSSDNNNRESDNTLNQLLVEMDGAKDNPPRILWIGATNRPELLDGALTRRLEKKITFSTPGLEDRKQLFALYAKDRPMADDVDLKYMAELTQNFSGAEVSALFDEAARRAGAAEKPEIGQDELQSAFQEVHLGTENTTLKMTEREKQKTAYHEAGHALVAHILGYHPVSYITVVPRAQALGVTAFRTEEDYAGATYDELINNLATSYGGRVAEGLAFSEGGISVGAYSDLETIRNIARSMVTQYGYTDNQITMAGGNGPESANAIDQRVSALMDKAQKAAEVVLREHRDKLDKLAAILVKKNTIFRDKFLEIAGPAPVPHPGEAKPIKMVEVDG